MYLILNSMCNIQKISTIRISGFKIIEIIINGELGFKILDRVFDDAFMLLHLFYFVVWNLFYLVWIRNSL
jgi:hypothetical protein